MSITNTESWTYYTSTIKTSECNINIAYVGVVDTKLEFSVSLDKAKYSELIIDDGMFDKVCPKDDQIVFSATVINPTVSVSLDLDSLRPDIQIFDLWLKDKIGNYCKVIKMVFLPLERALPQTCFVVGSPRSGTTAVGNLVQLAYNVKSHGEAHIGELFNGLIKNATDYLTQSPAAQNKGTLTQEISATFVEAQLIQNVRSLYLRCYPSQAIVDKTPGVNMMHSLPLLLKAFPNAKIVYCRRRGIENIVSRIRKFKTVSFEGHCRNWRRSINLWQTTKALLIANAHDMNTLMELEQFELAMNPDDVLKELLEFLQVDSARLKVLQRYLKNNSPQKSSDSPQQALSLETIDWTKEQVDLFLKHCQPTMKNCGYSLDESYYLID